MDSSEIKQYMIRGGSWSFIGKALMAVMGLALSSILARMLPPDDMGVYFLVFNLVGFFAIFACFGVEITLLRYVAESIAMGDTYRARESIRKGLILSFFAALITCLLFNYLFGEWLAISLFESRGLQSVVGFASLWIALHSFQILFGETFRSFRDIREAVLFGGGISISLTAMVIALLWFTGWITTLSEVLLCTLGAGAVNLFFAFVVLRKKLMGLDGDIIKSVHYAELVSHSWPLMLNAVVYYALIQSDLWVLASFYPSEDVAVYGAANRLVLLISVSIGVITTILYPVISRLYVLEKKKELEALLRKVSTWTGVFACLMFIVLFFSSEIILGIIFGDTYRAGSRLLEILAFSQVAIVFMGPCMSVLTLTGHQRIVFLVNCVIVVFAVLAKIELLNIFGLIGLATASSIVTIV